MMRLIAILSLSSSMLQAQLQFTEIYQPSFGALKGLHFFNDELGVVVEDHYLRMTTDGGQTWKSRFLYGMNASSCGISVAGDDTLFVLAEAKDFKVSYFHGFNGTPVQLYNSPTWNFDFRPTVCFIDSTVYVAGGFVDTSQRDPSGTRYLPGFLVSHDHGNTWKLQATHDISSPYYYIMGIYQRSGDTTAVVRRADPTMMGNTDVTFLWIDSMKTQLSAADPVPGSVKGCFSGICLTSKDYNVYVQKGSDASSWHLLSDDFWNLYYNAEVHLYEKDEFLFVDPSSIDDTEVKAFRFSSDDISAHLIDTSTYAVPRDKMLNYGRTEICHTDNYVYFLRTPSIIKVSRQGLSLPSRPEFGDNLKVFYQKDMGGIIIVGLAPAALYQMKIYNIHGGTVLDLGNSISSTQNSIDLENLQKGSYFLEVTHVATGHRAIEKIMKTVE